MKQVFLNHSGEIVVEEVPVPVCKDDGILVHNVYSLISSGTEMATIESTQGIISTAIRNREFLRKYVKDALLDFHSVINKLQERKNRLLPLGYSSAGIVITKGKNVDDISVGDLVACSGTKYANHAEIIYVPRNLAVKVPENVNLREAAFVSLGSIAMHSIRRAGVSLGDIVVVLGLGLIGQLTHQILRTAGCRVLGIDPVKERVDLAKNLGLELEIVAGENDPVKEVSEYTSGVGADAVIICAATKSSEPLELAAKLVRNKGKIVVIGAVGMTIPRTYFYRKELDVLCSRSYGPGRYDPIYEEKGIDYPIGYVRWTENRNMQEFLRLVSEKKISIEPLISHVIPIEDAVRAYQLLADKKNLGILLQYKYDDKRKKTTKAYVHVGKYKKVKGKINVAVIGTGNFARTVHLPNLHRISYYNIRAVVSTTPGNSKAIAKQYNAEYCTTNYRDVLEDDEVDIVLIATRHNLHAKIVVEAARAGKHVFVEKPMAMSYEECKEVEEAVRKNGVYFMVGFNRRFSPLSTKAKELIDQKRGPMIINCRVNVGGDSPTHWINDPVEGGGRIIGEACHFFDLFFYFTGSEVTEIHATSVSSEDYDVICDNNVVATLKFEDGSVASLIYTTLGDPNFPKEKVEIFRGGSVVVIDDFRELILNGFKDQGYRLKKQDKGHYNELLEFAKVIRGEKEPSFSIDDGVRATVCLLRVVDIIKLKNKKLEENINV